MKITLSVAVDGGPRTMALLAALVSGGMALYIALSSHMPLTNSAELVIVVSYGHIATIISNSRG
jgi:hypothetical protein